MRLVVVSYTFPPVAGIGGRRWAKFCKYLYRQGADFKVIAAEKKVSDPSPWLADTLEYQDRLLWIDDNYPAILSRIPATLLDKIKYKIAMGYVRLKIRMGSPFDPSYFFNKKAGKAVRQLLDQGYDTVIVTCAPFHCGYEIGRLKAKYPNVKFIMDFRDPWIANKSHYGFYQLNQKRFNDEVAMEKQCIENADLIFSVSDEMNQYFKKLSSKTENKQYFMVPNGFDPEDIQAPTGEVKIKEENIFRVVFTGNYYEHARYLLEELQSALKGIMTKRPHLSNRITFEFYGTVPGYFQDISLNSDGMIKYKGKLPLYEVYPAISSATLASLFLTDDMAFSRSTKFYEYVGMKKPILVFSNGRGTGEYVENENLGYNIYSGNMENRLLELIDKWELGIMTNKITGSTEKYSVNYIAKQIQEIINE